MKYNIVSRKEGFAMTDMDFEERKMEYDFNKFCRESCEEILSTVRCRAL